MPSQELRFQDHPNAQPRRCCPRLLPTWHPGFQLESFLLKPLSIRTPHDLGCQESDCAV